MKHAAVLLILFAVALGMARNKISHGPYGYDEADYMFAASLGMERNWIDAGSMPIGEFVETGRRRGTDASQQAGLSELARSGADPLVYRHWHGPLYFYWMSLPADLGLNEHTTRALDLVFPFLTVFAIYFGSLSVMAGVEGQVAGILASALFLWSPVTLETNEVAPHLLFVLCYVCGLLMLAKVAAGGGRRYFYAAAVFTGLGFCTLEVDFVLILTLGIVAWWRRERLGTDWKLIRNAAGILIATIVAVWPTALFKLSFAKAYMVMAYLAVFRKGAWGDVTFAQTWGRRFAMSPVEWLLVAAGLAVFAARGKRRWGHPALPFLIFSGLMMLATIKVYSDTARYETPFLAALDIFAGWMLAPVLMRLGRPALIYAATAAIGCGLIWNGWQRLSELDRSANPRAFATIDALRAEGLGEKTVLLPRMLIPEFHYYFPRMREQGYTEAAEIAARGGDADGVIYPDGSVKVR